PLLVPESADRIAVTLRGDTVAFGWLLDMIAVTHPGRHGLVGRETSEQTLWLQYLHFGASVLAAIGANYLTAFDVRDQLHPVTNAEHGRDIENGGIGERDVVAVN